MRSHNLLLDNAISWILLLEKTFFSCHHYFSILNPVTSLPGNLIYGQLSVAFLIPPCFRLFSNVDQFWKFVPKVFYNDSKFLSYAFKLFAAIDVSCLYGAYSGPELIINKFFLFVIIPNDRLSFFLNKLFFYDDRN